MYSEKDLSNKDRTSFTQFGYLLSSRALSPQQIATLLDMLEEEAEETKPELGHP